MARKKSGNAVSLHPNDAYEASGLFEGLGLLDEVYFDMYDYEGKVDEERPVLVAVIIPQEEADIGVFGDSVTQYWSVGNPDDFEPSDDGKQLLSTGRRESLNAACNGMIAITHFIKALDDAGESGIVDGFSDDVSVLAGFVYDWQRVPPPERKGLKSDSGQKLNNILVPIAVVQENVKVEYKKAASRTKSSASKGKPSGSNKRTGSESKSSTTERQSGKKTGAGSSRSKKKLSDEEIEEMAVGYILDILEDSDGEIKKRSIARAAMELPEFTDNPSRNEVLELMTDDEFLGASEEWEFEKGTLFSIN